MMLFLGAGASRCFGIQTMKGMEEEFNESLDKLIHRDGFSSAGTLYQAINRYIVEPSNLEEILTVLDDLYRMPADPEASASRYLRFLLASYFPRYHEKIFLDYYNLLAGLLELPDELLNKISVPPTDRSSRLHDATSRELFEAVKKEFMDGDKIARSERRILADPNLAGKLKLELVKFIINKCTIRKRDGYKTHIRPSIEKIYDDFFQILEGCNHMTPLSIFTTNYDQIIETYIEMKNDFEHFYDGFTYSNPKKTYGIWNPDGYNNSEHMIKLFKLHGSVDQYVDDGTIIKSSKPHNFENAMIYPTRNKEVYKEPYFELLTHLKDRLLSENVCIAIGYSFVDKHIQHIFIDAVKRNPSMKIILVDLNPSSAKKKLLKIDSNIIPIETEFGSEMFFTKLKDELSNL